MFRNVTYMASSTVGITENRTGRCITCKAEYKERNMPKGDVGLCCNTTLFHKQFRSTSRFARFAERFNLDVRRHCLPGSPSHNDSNTSVGGPANKCLCSVECTY